MRTVRTQITKGMAMEMNMMCAMCMMCNCMLKNHMDVFHVDKNPDRS